MGKFRKFVPWIVMAALCLLGLGLFSLRGFRFSAFACFALALLVLCYRLLYFLSRKKPKTARWLRTVLSIGLCVFLLAYAVTGVVIIQAGIGDVDDGCDYLIVLGAAVYETSPSLALRERLDAAATYLRRHPETVCIVSGGQGKGEAITEAECMFRYLTAAGIPESRVIKEDRSTSTQENIRFSLEQITRDETTRIGILSSEYHLFRAGLMARDQGFDPVLVPAETSLVTLRMNYYLREVAGVWYYLILGGHPHDFSFLCRPVLGTGQPIAFH